MDHRYFQWVAGERKNEVVIFDSIENDDDLVFINFKDGSRINEELVGELNAKSLSGKLMAEVDSPQNLWKFDEKIVGAEKEIWDLNEKQERVCVQPAVAGRKVITLIPPKKTTSKFGDIKEESKPKVETIIKEDKVSETSPNKPDTNVNETDPVYIMMNKSKKLDTEVQMTLTISLPTQNLFDVVKESFEDGEKKALEFIIEGLDLSEIKKSLKEGIHSMYNGDIQSPIDPEKNTINSLGEMIDPSDEN